MSDVAAAYSPQIVEHFRSPRGSGRLENGLCGQGGRAAAGVLIELSVRVAHGRIAEARFQAFGCPSAIACGSWLAEWLPGRELPEARALRGLDIASALALAPEKTGVALAAEDALRAALDAGESK